MMMMMTNLVLEWPLRQLNHSSVFGASINSLTSWPTHMALTQSQIRPPEGRKQFLQKWLHVGRNINRFIRSHVGKTNLKRRDPHVEKQNMQINFTPKFQTRFFSASLRMPFLRPWRVNYNSFACDLRGKLRQFVTRNVPSVSETASTSFCLFRTFSTSVTSFHSTKGDTQFEFARKNGQRHVNMLPEK